MKNKIKFAIAGFGDRGSTYASMQDVYPDAMEVVAVADLDPEKVEIARKKYSLPREACFSSAEELFAAEKLADVAVISTMDRQHVDHGILAINKGYDLLLEKPVSPDLQACKSLLELSEKTGKHVVVCHVLRYTAFYNKLRELILGGAIGDVVSVCANENVGYWHQAHSFVRGNWRNSNQTSPMILQKCCHDMDALMWLTGKTCESLSCVGNTYLFKPEMAPQGASKYCLQGCKAKENCIFDAEKIYIESERIGIKHVQSGFASVVCRQPTVEKVYNALQNGQYGRCVYHCDNDVVDHQQLLMQMTDGSTLAFTMCAFSENCYREFKAMGTKGEIQADMHTNHIFLRVFGKEEELIDVGTLTADVKGHGGGDSGIIGDLLELVQSGFQKNYRTTILADSLESHYLALAAEDSRLRGGERVLMKDFKDR